MRVVYLQEAAGIEAGTEKNISSNGVVVELVKLGIVEPLDKNEYESFVKGKSIQAKAPEAENPKKLTKAELIAKCESLGIEVDPKWKVEDLNKAIADFEAAQAAAEGTAEEVVTEEVAKEAAEGEESDNV
jgi:hypothetical protein